MTNFVTTFGILTAQRKLTISGYLLLANENQAKQSQ
jgi:hypothetical protein